MGTSCDDYIEGGVIVQTGSLLDIEDTETDYRTTTLILWFRGTVVVRRRRRSLVYSSQTGRVYLHLRWSDVGCLTSGLGK